MTVECVPECLADPVDQAVSAWDCPAKADSALTAINRRLQPAELPVSEAAVDVVAEGSVAGAEEEAVSVAVVDAAVAVLDSVDPVNAKGPLRDSSETGATAEEKGSTARPLPNWITRRLMRARFR